MKSEPAPAPDRTYRPKAERFTTLAWLWFFPSAGALFILGTGWASWRDAASLLAILSATRLEHWVALGLLLLHVSFFLLARRYRRTEVPGPIPPAEPDDPPASAASSSQKIQ